MSDIDSLFAPIPHQPPPGLSIADLRAALQRASNILVALATGKALPRQVSADYLKLDRLLVANFRRLGLAAPFPWRNVAEWMGFYKQGMPTYKERAEHIAALTKAALDALDATERTGLVHDPSPEDDDPSWGRVNTRVAGLIAEYSAAGTHDDWQDVGRRSREILIDVGKLIVDPALVPEGKEAPNLADVREWFDLLLAKLAPGKGKTELRGLLRSTWDLANKVTHADIDDVDAFASAQATVLLARTIQKLLVT